MSTLREVAELSAELSDEDYGVLRSLARLLGLRRHAPVSLVSAMAGLTEKEAERSLRKLGSLRLVSRGPAGYSLLYAGLDALSLHELRSRGQLDALGTPIAMGKESDVYSGISGSREVAVKAYRIGRVSFRRVKRLRVYGPQAREWMLASIRSAAAEFRNLRRLSSASLPVPEPLAVRYHVLVMERLNGVLLRYVRDVPDPRGLLAEVLGAVRRCYLEGGLVNSDLSEFNVIVGREGVILIDWPQSLDARSPGAERFMERDVNNLVSFFSKRFGLRVDARAALEYALGLRADCC
ncbi:MAG: RIO1 family regulatory kinase/ATPase [Conexivisphaera sp.]